jgi:hypothetical protein
MKPETLSAIVSILNHGSWNYSVFLESYSVPSLPGTPSEQLICTALGGSAVLASIETVTPKQVAEKVQMSLIYAGDSGAGPDPESLRSERFGQLLSSLLAELEATWRHASRIEQFRLKEGHPAYPVFWDFAFLFTNPSEVIVLIGSSSD